jgi:hypothetical protein
MLCYCNTVRDKHKIPVDHPDKIGVTNSLCDVTLNQQHPLEPKTECPPLPASEKMLITFKPFEIFENMYCTVTGICSFLYNGGIKFYL